MRKLLYLRCLSIGLFLSFTCFAQERTITGSVISNVDNNPMTGVSVTVKGKNLTTQTNANGTFSI
ncbi:MAG TPA: carboxypeptidase-like regulatory domain-containing protein, partial [Bacteroidia bacterium]|nr:carboxypeptidase-like regulatory domain-containing protein [Bacteroidia bacterium]